MKTTFGYGFDADTQKLGLIFPSTGSFIEEEQTVLICGTHGLPITITVASVDYKYYVVGMRMHYRKDSFDVIRLESWNSIVLRSVTLPKVSFKTYGSEYEKD